MWEKPEMFVMHYKIQKDYCRDYVCFHWEGNNWTKSILSLVSTLLDHQVVTVGPEGKIAKS